jgi:hypothetical protein
MMDIDAQDESAWDEACLHPHHGDVAQVEVADAFTSGRHSGPIRKIVWKKRGTLERARWHAGLFEFLIRMRKVFHEYLLGCKQTLCHSKVRCVDGVLEL